MSFLLPFLPKIAAIGGVALMALLAFLGIRRSGVQKQQLANSQKTLEQVERRDAAEADVAGKSDAAVADELRSRWTR